MMERVSFMVEYRRGIENIPLKEVNKNLPILVIIYDLRNGDNVVTETRLNYGDYEDRKYLGRLSFWALTNHCSIETIAITDAEVEYQKTGENQNG
jgi:hypothetical protein